MSFWKIRHKPESQYVLYEYEKHKCLISIYLIKLLKIQLIWHRMSRLVGHENVIMYINSYKGFHDVSYKNLCGGIQIFLVLLRKYVVS